MSRVRRRRFLVAWAALTSVPFAVCAQARTDAQRSKRLIAFLGDGSRAQRHDITVDPLREGLRSLGYVEGRDIVIEERWTDDMRERLPELVREIVALKPDIIVTHGVPAAMTAKEGTTTIPIVIGSISDPVVAGIVPSLARPGGNITGLTDQVLDLAEKEVQIFREIVPNLRRIAILWNKANPGARLTFEETRKAVEKHGLKYTACVAAERAQLEGAVRTAARAQSDGLIIVHDVFTLNNRARIAELALRHRLPSISSVTPYVGAGGLIAYGINFSEQYHRAAAYVDKILKGAKPADLPFEQPTKFELMINLKTAKALGVAIPRTVLLRADRVIE